MADKIKLDLSEEPEDRVMPFGKYKGVPLGKVPDSYLRWAIDEFDDEGYDDLVEAMERVLMGRVEEIFDEDDYPVLGNAGEKGERYYG